MRLAVAQLQDVLANILKTYATKGEPFVIPVTGFVYRLNKTKVTKGQPFTYKILNLSFFPDPARYRSLRLKRCGRDERLVLHTLLFGNNLFCYKNNQSSK